MRTLTTSSWHFQACSTALRSTRVRMMYDVASETDHPSRISMSFGHCLLFPFSNHLYFYMVHITALMNIPSLDSIYLWGYLYWSFYISLILGITVISRIRHIQNTEYRTVFPSFKKLMNILLCLYASVCLHTIQATANENLDFFYIDYCKWCCKDNGKNDLYVMVEFPQAAQIVQKESCLIIK